MSAVTVSEHTSPSSGSLSRKNSNFAIRNIFRSSKRHRSKESIDTVSTKSCEKEQVKSSSEPKQDTMMCNVCFSWKNTSLFPVLLSCEHRNCIDCLKQYLVIAVKECRVMVSCPECSEVFHPSDVRMIFNDDNLFAKYEEFTLRRALVGIPDIRWCPAPDCGYAVIASGCASCPQLKCMRPGCSYEFCYHCRQLWHPNTTCDLARMQNQFEIRSLSSADRKSSNMHEDIKPCPKCMALIIKMDDGSCNHMTCAVCGGEFCWLCMKEISDLHYLSPSGCTFWGKKPWSRKKKIMWQMGTLIGAPVGIGLAAGVVLPAMMIGIPIYVGRRIRERFDYSENVHKRNLAITGGVALSVIVSPFLAALTVGVGVPIALGYVYGVVPVSLCRSGGCTGVTKSRNGHGVNFEFNEREDTYTLPGVASVKSSPVRRNSGNSSMLDTASVLTQGGSVLTVKATITKDHQPSISGSNDSTSLDGRSFITSFRSRDHDVDSHASLIPAPRSTTISITSSLDNVNTKSASNSNISRLPEVSCEETNSNCSVRKLADDTHSIGSCSSSRVNDNTSSSSRLSQHSHGNSADTSVIAEESSAAIDAVSVVSNTQVRP
ncbi:E3 ubiquitin-protein ligase RNF19A-like [Hydractinia symbiolongicarpus]|uniref:E3 ubiquitin-protein ligase RNF19A-like n=1 Tax=Hydractinia symbiolongicarpus TaxID=13093 RepID=UPI0025507B3A|nr:E3 ubiquitin-protein ligase RNF19A-like [Hydractinia symbiolongicarpus]